MRELKQFSVKEAVRWIRDNCDVDTGDGITGSASIYTENEIASAIRSWSDKRRGKKAVPQRIQQSRKVTQ